jgi:hypothetical protein
MVEMLASADAPGYPGALVRLAAAPDAGTWIPSGNSKIDRGMTIRADSSDSKREALGHPALPVEAP